MPEPDRSRFATYTGLENLFKRPVRFPSDVAPLEHAGSGTFPLAPDRRPDRKRATEMPRLFRSRNAYRDKDQYPRAW